MPHRLCQATAAGLVIGHKAVMHTVRQSGAFVNLLVCCVAAAYTHKVSAALPKLPKATLLAPPPWLLYSASVAPL
jgi:hypothetical protein